MYTSEQYARAKALISDPDAEAKYGPERMGKVRQNIEEYDKVNAQSQADQPALSESDIDRLQTPLAIGGPLPNDNIAPDYQYHPPDDFDDTLPNATKRKKYTAPPEYVTKSPGKALATLAKNRMLDPLNGNLGAMYFEPSEKQFAADMGEYLKAKGVAPGSEEYNLAYADYKDRKWEQAYAQAAAKDEPLLRVAYVPNNASGWTKLQAYLAEKTDAATAFAQGFASGGSFGATRVLQSDADREQLARHPIAEGVGSLGGAVSPGSLVGKLAGGIGRTATKLGVGRYGSAALAGGISTPVDIAAHTGADALSDRLHGRPVDQDAKSQFGLKLLGGALIGGLGGAAGEGIARFAQGTRQNLRQATNPLGTELTNAESTGTATDALRGLKPSSDVERYLDKARGPVPGENRSLPTGNAVEYAAADVRGPLVARQGFERDAALQRMEKESGQLFAGDSGLRQPKPMNELVRTLREHILERSQPEAAGDFLPGAGQAIGGRNNAPLIDFARRVIKPRLVLDVDAAKEAARTGGHVVSLEDAERMGFSVKGLGNELNPETGIPHNAPSLSDYDAPAAAVGEFAAAHPDLPLVQRYLNETRAANGLAERAGFPRETSAAMNGFLKDAESAGHLYKGKVYRGATPSELERVLQGQATPSAWSVSRSVDGAMPFAKKGGVLFEIEGGAVPTDGVPGSNTFEEALIPHGAPLRVVGRRNENGIEIVTLKRPDAAPAPAGELGATQPEIAAPPGGNPTVPEIAVPENYNGKSFKVILEPRAYDAMKMEAQIKAIDQAGKAGTEAKVDPVWPELMRAARVDREQFGKAWSGLKNVHHEQLTALEQRAAHAGITENQPYEGMSGNAQKTANSAITNYGVAPQETNKALAELADNAGVRQNLETLRGTRAYTALNERAMPNFHESLGQGGGFARVGGLLPGIRLRADALARNVARGPEGNPLFAESFNPKLLNEPLGREVTPSGPFSNLLSMGRGALGVKTGSVYDSSTGRAGPGSTLSPDEKAILQRLLEQP